MRAANLIFSVLGIAGLGIATTIAWRWRNAPLVAGRQPGCDTPGGAALDGVHTLVVAMSAGIIAGALVPGLGGRLVMRILAATSGSAAQGRTTDAGEIVGEITNGGTLAVVFFVGVYGGIIAALAFVVVRRWLPAHAGAAGVVTGILLLGTIGVGDAMSPDNRDFAILRPTWLAITLVVVLAVLFGVTFTALAARFDTGIPTLSGRPSSIASHASLVVFLFPLLLVTAAAYVSGRAVLHGRLAALIASSGVQRAGHVVVGAAASFATISGVQAIAEIATA